MLLTQFLKLALKLVESIQLVTTERNLLDAHGHLFYLFLSALEESPTSTHTIHQYS